MVGEPSRRLSFDSVRSSSIFNLVLVAVWFWALAVSPAAADPPVGSRPFDWVEGTQGLDDGATRDYYNRAAWLGWQSSLGDWSDADGTAQGSVPFATVAMVDDDTPEHIEWDLTDLVVAWLDGEYPNQGLLMRLASGSATYNFASREAANPAERPELLVVTTAGSYPLTAQADTFTDSSTYQCFGDADYLRVASGSVTLIRFDLSPVDAGATVLSATLRVYVTAEYGSATVGVFRSSQGHDEPPSDPITGLAALFQDDVGIGDHPDVYLFSDFETASWGEDWSHGSDATTLERVSTDPANLFLPLRGVALRVEITEGGHYGMNVGFNFADEVGFEPEEIYFRYYLRVGDDWNTVDGGKLPGPSGTYGVAGWGGRPSDGSNGWSARGTFRVVPPPGNTFEDSLPVGSYVYHADMVGTYGDSILWQNDYRGYLEKNRWYSVEQYLQMNTPGINDGVMRAWIDGRLAWEKTDWRWRDIVSLKIEKIWMNVYHGGTAAAAQDVHLYMDNVVIANQYIGPLNFTSIFADGFEWGSTGAWTAAVP